MLAKQEARVICCRELASGLELDQKERNSGFLMESREDFLEKSIMMWSCGRNTSAWAGGGCWSHPRLGVSSQLWLSW